MIGQDPDRHLHVMLIPGDKRLKIKRVRQIAGGLAIELLSPEALTLDFGFTVGAISPTQLIGRAKQFYLDNTVFREELVDISSGNPNAGLELRLEDLVRLVNPIRCDIISTRTSD
jgi:Ala-tRNA(Pro) deacylase